MEGYRLGVNSYIVKPVVREVPGNGVASGIALVADEQDPPHHS
jgi:hypothetical protein